MTVLVNDKMSSKLSCVFKCEAVSGRIMKFTDDNLKQCRDILRIRVDDVHGYHSGCRKNFLAIPKKYIEKYEQLQNKSTEENANPTLVDAASTSFASTSGNLNIHSNSL